MPPFSVAVEQLHFPLEFSSVSQEHLATETIFKEIFSGTDSSLILGELPELTGIRAD